MTQPTTESRLDRLEAIAENVLLSIQQQQQQFQANQSEMREYWLQQQQQNQTIRTEMQQQNQAIRAEMQEQRQQILSVQVEMRQSIGDVMQMIVTLAETADEDRKNIVGIQTENRRILDILINRE